MKQMHQWEFNWTARNGLSTKPNQKMKLSITSSRENETHMMLLLHIQEMCTLTDSVTVALLCCQTNCYFRNNSITHGLHAYWIDSGQDNSWVMCIRRSLSQHFLDSFHQAVYQTVQNLTTRWVTHTDVELQSQDLFFRGSLCKHCDSSKSLGRLSVTLFWDLQVALRFLTPPS